MPKLDGTYCPPQEMTIDWEMSKIRYAIIIQQMDSRSVAHIKTFGTVVSGINKLDAILAESDLHTEASILKIIEMFHAGKEVRIVKKADVLKIYNVVNLFLCQWAEKITSDFLGHVYPLEELHVIEQFASYIYQRCYELGLEVKAPDEWANDFKDQGVLLSDLDTLLRGNMAKKDEPKPIEIPERESLEPFFDRNLDERFKGRYILEFRDSPLQREVDRVFTNGKSQAYYSYRGTIYIDKYQFDILKILELDIVRDYYKSNQDYVNLNAVIPGGMYVKRIYPNRDKLKIEIRKVPLGERIDSQDSTREIESEIYKAVMEESGNPRVEQNEMNTPDETALNLTNLLTVRFQLFDLTIEQIRMLQVGGSYRNENQEDVLKNILNETATKISADSDIRAYGVDIVPMKDKVKRNHVLIPQDTKVIDLPSFIQEKMGLYSTGLAQYFQDKYWYVFPKYDYTRFQSSSLTLTVINVPAKQMPNVERTYLLEGSDLTILATGEVKFNDRTVIDKFNSGNGTRLTKASNVIDNFVEVKSNIAKAKRRKTNNEFYTKENYEHKNYAPISTNNVSDNLFKETSKLAGKDGYYISFVWQNSIPSYILPGMMTKILYLDEGIVRTVEGCVIKTHHAIHPEEAGMMGNRYLTQSGITVFIDTKAVDPERLYNE